MLKVSSLQGLEKKMDKRLTANSVELCITRACDDQDESELESNRNLIAALRGMRSKIGALSSLVKCLQDAKDSLDASAVLSLSLAYQSAIDLDFGLTKYPAQKLLHSLVMSYVERSAWDECVACMTVSGSVECHSFSLSSIPEAQRAEIQAGAFVDIIPTFMLKGDAKFYR